MTAMASYGYDCYRPVPEAWDCICDKVDLGHGNDAYYIVRI